MKYHKITIKSLGPIQDIKNFEIRKVNMVIGESAVGKSVLAKAISIFNDKEFLDRLLFEDDRSSRIPHKNSFYNKDILQQYFDSYFPKYRDYTIDYFYSNDWFIKVQKKEKKTTLTLSPKLKDKIQEVKDLLQDTKKSLEAEKIYEELKELIDKQKRNREKVQVPSSKTTSLKYRRKSWRNIIENIQKEESLTFIDRQKLFFKDLGILNTIFIPATRSFVSDFDNLRLRILRPYYSFRMEGGDISLYNFSEIYRRLLRIFESLDESYHKLMKGKVKKIIENKISFFIGNQELDISEISSGQKELFPILLILQDIIQFKKSCFLIIEEPEAHLFPKDQRDIFEHIIEAINKNDSKIFITTHSPYMLMCANNLIEAKSKNYVQLKDKYISSQDVIVHKLLDGKSESIVNEDTNLIDGDYMESIEDEICEQYNKILNTKSK